MKIRISLEVVDEIEIEGIEDLLKVEDGAVVTRGDVETATLSTMIEAKIAAGEIEESFSFADFTTVCRGCGCTDDEACPGGCSWVELDLCSRCAATIARRPL